METHATMQGGAHAADQIFFSADALCAATATRYSGLSGVAALDTGCAKHDRACLIPKQDRPMVQPTLANSTQDNFVFSQPARFVELLPARPCFTRQTQLDRQARRACENGERELGKIIRNKILRRRFGAAFSFPEAPPSAIDFALLLPSIRMTCSLEFRGRDNSCSDPRLPSDHNQETKMSSQLNQQGQDLLFRNARTHNAWLPKPVSDDTLRQLYDLMKWGPTSVNCSPARILFVRTPEAKERLLAALAPGNIEKTRSAPVTAVIGYDGKFYEQLPRLFPHTDARAWFADTPELAEVTARRNSSLQGAYFMIAARALGLDCGPMSGFDQAKMDHEFFPAPQKPNFEFEYFPDSHIKTNFLCNIGYGDPAGLYPRSPRLEFDEACKLL